MEEIGLCVKEHLDALMPGCRYTITGGYAWDQLETYLAERLALTLVLVCRYRRGKPDSNDVDIVFCPSEDGKDVGLLHDLYMRMGDLGELRQFRRSSHPCH